MNSDEEIFAALGAWGADLDTAIERFCGDKEFYIDCLKSFIEDPGFNDLPNALNSKEYEQAFDAAHTLKGVAGNLGLNPLYTVICNIVEPLRAKDYSNLDALYKDVVDSYEELKKLI